MRAHLLLIVLLCFSAATPAEENARPQALRIVVQADVYRDYLRFLGNRTPVSITRYDGPFSRRDVVEVVLLQQALQRGGETRPVRFVLTDSDSRIVKMLAQGAADVSGSSLWKTDADAARLPVSRALVRPGEFEAGIYLLADHPALAELAHDPGLLSRLTAVCAASWHPDIATLRTLNSRLLLTENWDSMLGMLKKKRADFLLAPFQPTTDFRLEAGGLTLRPVAGLKVSLSGSRHFLLGTGSGPSALLQHLDAGLVAMEQDGRVSQAYRESGFADIRVKNWRRLNAALTTAARP